MPPSTRSLSWIFALAVFLGAGTSVAEAQFARSGPHAHVVEPPVGSSSFGLGSFAAYEPVVAPFQPENPETGIPLALAYAPSPLLFIDGLFDDDVRRDVVMVQLVAGVVGAMVSGWALFDALDREQMSDIAFSSLATAHALGWNLQMAISAAVRLGIGQLDGPRVDALVPTIIAFPVRGGAGIAPQWIF